MFSGLIAGSYKTFPITLNYFLVFLDMFVL